MGEPTGRNISQLVTVPLAAVENALVLGRGRFGVVCIAAGGWRLSAWRRMKRQVQDLERLRDLEQERFRIAQNIHDDIGARVTEIALLSSAAQLKPQPCRLRRARISGRLTV